MACRRCWTARFTRNLPWMAREHGDIWTRNGPSLRGLSASVRWLVPPAARLAIHLCIGMAYGFSVFWLPMSKLLASPDARPGPKSISDWTAELFTSQLATGSVKSLETFTFTSCSSLFSSIWRRALWGGWRGARRSAQGRCGGCGLLVRRPGAGRAGRIPAPVVDRLAGHRCAGRHRPGAGLHLVPVPTLIKWFPDRRGMATGFAIMGYGGGAMIEASPAGGVAA